jgi:hypothetical protein
MPLTGLDLARGLGESHFTARLLSARAFATNVRGDPAGAARDNAEALRLSRQAGDRLHAGKLLCNLSDCELWTVTLMPPAATWPSRSTSPATSTPPIAPSSRLSTWA